MRKCTRYLPEATVTVVWKILTLTGFTYLLFQVSFCGAAGQSVETQSPYL